ncbi:MAG: sugar transferase [Actinobacteria bacterium]|nr:sugar transferase [Actinomycetota bacterium]
MSTLTGDATETTLSLAFVPAWVVIAKALGLYDRDHRRLRHLTVDELPSLFAWTLTGTAGLTLVLAARPVESFVQLRLAIFGSALLTAFALRSSARFLWRRITPRERTLIVGGGRLAKAAQRKLELFPDIHASLIGVISVDAAMGRRQISAHWLRDVDRVILASSTIREQFLSDLVVSCRESHTKLSVVPPLRSMFGSASRLSRVSDLTVIEYNTWDVSESTLVLKRAMDFCSALVALTVLLPVAVLIALVIRLGGPGPILFRQLRAGQLGRPFQMYKFRTMVPDAEARLSEVVSLEQLREPMFKLKRDPRVTRVGRVLRRTSMDELPQLVNVLKGQMSLVGPRPEQVDLVERYDCEHRFVLAVKPGLTGPMQVFGRGNLTFEERLAVERDYIENLSLGRDFRILAMTIAAVFNRQGAF